MRPGLLDLARDHHGMAAVGDELDDDLRVLRLALEPFDDPLLDLRQVEAGDRHGADVGHVDRAVIGHALDAEIGARPLDGREDAAFVGLEDTHLEHVARRHQDARAGRQIAGDRRTVDAGRRTEGDDAGGRQIDDVERQGLGAGALGAAHPGPVAGHHLAAREAECRAREQPRRVARQGKARSKLSNRDLRPGRPAFAAPLPRVPWSCLSLLVINLQNRAGASGWNGLLRWIEAARGPPRRVSATSSSCEKPETSRQSAAEPEKRQNTTWASRSSAPCSTVASARTPAALI